MSACFGKGLGKIRAYPVGIPDQESEILSTTLYFAAVWGAAFSEKSWPAPAWWGRSRTIITASS